MSLWAPTLSLGPFRLPGLFAMAAGRPAAPARERAPEQADDRRFRDLMLPHLDAAYTLARYLMRDPVAAEDVVQEAYLRAFRAFPGYRGGEPKAWLLTIVRNCAFSWKKAERGGAAGASLAFGSGEGPELENIGDPDQETAETTLVRQGEILAVRKAISDLPEPFRETLVLRELQDLSYKEIAALTASPIGTVMSRLARARAMLAEALKPAGGAA
jgi:RNA polymerase sigma-70 factor (ECF subfamily)